LPGSAVAERILNHLFDPRGKSWILRHALIIEPEIEIRQIAFDFRLNACSAYQKTHDQDTMALRGGALGNAAKCFDIGGACILEGIVL